MNEVPGSLLSHIRDFSAELRKRHSHCQDIATNNYRAFLRGNIVGVIAKTFPLFSKYVGNETVILLTDNFLAEHGAEEAEFHHIATEFVKFLRSGELLDKEKVQLIEYEWVLFYAEIDPADVTGFATSECSIADNFSIVLNPTLQFIHLPFSVEQGELVMCRQEDFHTYGIFRNKNDEVMKKTLTSFDHAILHLLIEENISNLTELESALPSCQSARFPEWVDYHQKINFISLQRR